MRRKKRFAVISAALALVLLLSGCGQTGKAAETAETAEPVSQPSPVSSAQPAEPPVPEAEPERQDGERFEEVIILEGMEETVPYEHVRNDALGFEMDYDYERFERRSEADRECFVSVWDGQENPENYLELTYHPEHADTVAVSINGTLSNKYELLRERVELERAGSCTRIEASELKGTGEMADQLQVVYIIPASDGCIVAAEHFSSEGAEGFGRRFSCMLNTLAVLNR